MVFGHYSATTARLVHIIPSFIQYKGHPFLSSPLYIFSLYYYTTYKRELWELLSSISLAFCNALAKLAIASVAVFILSVSFRANSSPTVSILSAIFRANSSPCHSETRLGDILRAIFKRPRSHNQYTIFFFIISYFFFFKVIF